jgi:protein O-GlcNAc transferase
MRGVDWRKKIKNSVEHFHETAGMDVLQLAQLIRNHKINILVDWDGYSHNGIRPTGLFPIQPAPVQVVHQEYIGTMGAPYFQYQVSDIKTSPEDMWPFHTEKFIMMPHTFFVNSFSYQSPDLVPTPEVLPLERQPSHNGCGGAPAEFVYCNFNKHLKFDPKTFKGWLQTLQSIKGSVLCLLEFPAESKPNLVKFIKNVDPKLISRVRFQPFMNNPYDNQRRVVDMCHAVLDTPIYNGHTTSMEALFGGVPVVSRSDYKDMSALVGTSALKTLNIPELIANSTEEYQRISKRLGTDSIFFQDIRKRLIASTKCTKESPLNPLWDLKRYVKALENGYAQIWDKWLYENKIENVFALDTQNDSSFYCPWIKDIEDRSNSRNPKKKRRIDKRKKRKRKKGKKRRKRKAHKNKRGRKRGSERAERDDDNDVIVDGTEL